MLSDTLLHVTSRYFKCIFYIGVGEHILRVCIKTSCSRSNSFEIASKTISEERKPG